MKVKHRNWSNVGNYKQAIEHAVDRGAKHRVLNNGVNELKGPAGTVLMTCDDETPIPREAKKNLWKWFKLAGLLALLLYVWFRFWFIPVYGGLI